jgi:glycogen phosphorylase
MNDDSPSRLQYRLPRELEPIGRLALNLRWVWNHATDRIWESLAADIWRRTHNPILVLQNTPRSRLLALARDEQFIARVQELDRELSLYLSRPSWYESISAGKPSLRIAYFSMEYGLTEALPLYSGGLGVLAGDHLKTASDLGIPLTAVGLLYREGYFRQMLDAQGRQLEVYAINSRDCLPIQPVVDAEGRPLRTHIDLPGRQVRIRIWHAAVGRVDLYLLDSDDPLNSPFDRGITSKLYGGDSETRLMQEVVLGMGGWRALEALGIEPDVCHLNEGHAALATIERARAFADANCTDFLTGLRATRAGNVFTTHTPVAAAFDTFPPSLIKKYGMDYAARCGMSPDKLLDLGRANAGEPGEPFNLAIVAAHNSSHINGVSELHGRTSKSIFAPLYPRWPEPEIPVTHVTNAVHVPSWDSPWADRIWTEACGKERWLGEPRDLREAVSRLSDAELWDFRAMERRDLVDYARRRLQRQLSQRGESLEDIARSRDAFDPNVLTLGFARRFTEYKRPTLLLKQTERLVRLLTNPACPVQLLIAGKAHPRDAQGRAFVREWAEFVRRPEVRQRVVFLEDHDMTLAEHLVQGVDVWINTPRRPWEASGTSGMKVLVNGGLNLSELDGWWAEAYAPELGWALGDGREHAEPGWDDTEAEQLFRILEDQVVPEFYERDADGIPRAWVSRIRASLSQLTPRFSSNRMLGEYLERLYRPAAEGYWRRTEQHHKLARDLEAWSDRLHRCWPEIHWGNLEVIAAGDASEFRLQLYLGEIDPEAVKVQLYAEPEAPTSAPEAWEMRREHALSGAAGGFLYTVRVPPARARDAYTPRVIPWHPDVPVPNEVALISWYPRGSSDTP